MMKDTLVTKKMRLADLEKADYNPRSITAEAMKGLRKSLSEFGLVQPIIWNKRSGNIVGGHQRYDAMVSQGQTETEVIVVDLDDTKEKALNLSLNNQAISGDFTRGAWDVLEDLKLEVSEEYLEDLMLDELEDFLPPLPPEPDPDPNGGERKTYAQPFMEAEIIDHAFRHYRSTGFPYRKLTIHSCMQEINQLSQVEPENQGNSIVGYHVADTYHPHRFHVTVDGKINPFDAFEDDRKLIRSLKLAYDEGAKLKGLLGPMMLVLGTQACSNFRPAYAMSLYREFCGKDSMVLDTSTGYGGRLVGAMASGVVKKYVGVDPNTLTHKGNKKMVSDLGWGESVELINKPVEDLKSGDFEIDGFDFAFTSPPYFTKEHYSEEKTQSWKRYPTATNWREGFLLPMLKFQHDLLKKGAVSVVNIADVKVKGELFECVKWCIQDAEDVGFVLEERREFGLTARFGANQEEGRASEAVLVFRK
jgi:hypothetical protein